MTDSSAIKGHMQQALDLVRQLAEERDYFRDQYEAVYRDLATLGEALGHPKCARPESAMTQMRIWTEEVKALVAKYEPERLDALKQEWRIQ